MKDGTRRTFFPEIWEAFSKEGFLKNVCRKYHYGETDMESLRCTAEAMLPRMGEQACWNHRLFGVSGVPVGSEAVITLGKGLDELQEEYSSKGLLSECYMVEALSSELLLLSYSAYNRELEKESGLHVARLHFLGSEETYPMTILPDLLKRLQMSVSCNEAFCMVPKKSVAFYTELTEDRAVRCPGICVGCNSRHCPNRIEERENITLKKMLADMTDVPLSYGYRRIFGGK